MSVVVVLISSATLTSVFPVSLTLAFPSFSPLKLISSVPIAVYCFDIGTSFLVLEQLNKVLPSRVTSLHPSSTH